MIKSIQQLFPIQKLFPLLAYSAEYEEERETYTQEEFKAMGLTFTFLLGLSLLLAGIIFFFAFNWQNISDFSKFALIQGVFLVSIVGSYLLGLESVLGKLALLFASILVGVFLAVFGQIYQTGADSYMLFLVWTIAILPFALISKFPSLWALCILLTNTTIYLYLTTVFRAVDNFEYILLLTLTFINASLLIARELLASKLPWLSHSYTRHLLFFLLQACIVFSLFNGILDFSFSDSFFERDKENSYLIALTLIINIGLSTLLYFTYRYKYKDFFVVANTLLVSTCMLVFFLITQSDFEVESVFLLAIMAIAIFSAFGKFIEHVYKSMKNERLANSNNEQDEQYEQGEKIEIENQSNSIANELDSKADKVRSELEKQEETKSAFNPQDFFLIGSRKKSINKADTNDSAPPIMKSLAASAAVISALIILALLVLIYSLSFERSPFFFAIGIGSLGVSVFMHRVVKDKESSKTSYFMSYQSTTFLLLSYVLITIDLVIFFEASLTVIALVLSALTCVVYLLIDNIVSRMFICMYALAAIYSSIYENYQILTLFRIFLLAAFTFGFIYLRKKENLRTLFDSFFIASNLLILLFLLEFSQMHTMYFTLNPLLYTIVLGVWICALYYLYSKSIEGFWNTINKSKALIHVLGLACLVFLVYFGAFPLLYIFGIMLLSIYLQEIKMLRQSLLFSILAISLYYYTLYVDLLTKSILLFVSGFLLLAFCAYNKEGFKHA